MLASIFLSVCFVLWKININLAGPIDPYKKNNVEVEVGVGVEVGVEVKVEVGEVRYKANLNSSWS